MESPAGSGLTASWCQQIVAAVPGVSTRGAPLPLIVEQLVDVLQFFDALVLVA